MVKEGRWKNAYLRSRIDKGALRAYAVSYENESAPVLANVADNITSDWPGRFNAEQRFLEIGELSLHECGDSSLYPLDVKDRGHLRRLEQRARAGERRLDRDRRVDRR